MRKYLAIFVFQFFLSNVTSNSSLAVSSIVTFRIVILAWNRPSSLLRLLRSLETSDYTFVKNNPFWDILVEIRVDGGGGAEGEKVRAVAEEWSCDFLNKVLYSGMFL